MYICFLLLGRAQQILIIISEREMKRIEWMMAALYIECNLYLLAPLSSTVLFIAHCTSIQFFGAHNKITIQIA